MAKENKVKFGIVAFVIILSLILIIFAFHLAQDHNSENNDNPYKMEKVTEYGIFFSIVNNINKYLFYSYSKNSSALINILNKDYLKKNNITISNVLSKIANYENSPSFKAKEIYFKDIDDNYLCYAKGDIVYEEYEGIVTYKENVDFLILLDYTNFTIEIYPLDLNSNKEELPLVISKIAIAKNSYNSLETSKIITNDYICNLYYAEFYMTLVNDINKSYSLLDNDFKKENFNTLTEFQTYWQDNISKINSNIKSCSMSEMDGLRYYTIIDSNNNSFEFRENKIMDYSVKFTIN